MYSFLSNFLGRDCSHIEILYIYIYIYIYIMVVFE